MSDETQEEQGNTLNVMVVLPEFEKLCEFIRTSVIFGCMAAILMIVLGSCTSLNMDDTDNRQTGARSGLTLRTDHGTGCQYLVQRDIMIARVDINGKHVGCR